MVLQRISQEDAAIILCDSGIYGGDAPMIPDDDCPMISADDATSIAGELTTATPNEHAPAALELGDFVIPGDEGPPPPNNSAVLTPVGAAPLLTLISASNESRSMSSSR